MREILQSSFSVENLEVTTCLTLYVLCKTDTWEIHYCWFLINTHMERFSFKSMLS